MQAKVKNGYQIYFKIAILSIAIIAIALIIYSQSWSATNDRAIKSTNKLTNTDQQNSASIIPLEKDKPVTRELKDKEVHSYSLAIEANQYLNLMVDQQGINVVVAVFDSAGKKIYEINSPNGLYGQEPVYLIAESNGPYRLEVKAAEPGAQSGKYQATITELRTAIDKDSPRVASFKALMEALQLNGQTNPLLNDQIETKLKAAIKTLEMADDPLAQAYVLNSAAFFYKYNKGDYGKAASLLQKVLDIRERALGPDHVEIANALDDVGEMYAEDGDLKKAEMLHQKALAMQTRLFGPESLAAALSINYLANLYQSTEDYRKSEECYLKVIAIEEKILGPDHVDLAIVLDNLGHLYQIKEDYVQEETLYQRVLAIRQKAYGPTHVGVAESLNNLATLYRIKGDYLKAEPYYLQALKIRENLLGPENPYVAVTLTGLALMYDNKGDDLKAEILYQRALKINQKTLGPEHTSVAVILSHLGLMYQNRGNFIKAEEVLKRSLAMIEKTLGRENSGLVLPLNDLATLYTNINAYDKAEALLKRALAIDEKTFGAEYGGLAPTLNNLATVYEDREELNKAEPLYQRALALEEKLYGQDSPPTALVLNNLGKLYTKKQEFAKAESMIKRAIAIIEKIYIPASENLTIAINNLAALYKGKGDIDQAIKYKERADESREVNLTKYLIPGSQKEKLAYLNLSRVELHETISLHLLFAPNNVSVARLALTDILRRKGRALDAMTDNIAILRRRANKEDQALFEQLFNVRNQYAVLSLRGADKEDAKQYRAHLKTLEEQIESLEKLVSSKRAEFKTQAQPITLNTIQQVIPDNAALIEFIAYNQYDKYDKNNRQKNLGEKHYAAYVLTNRGEPLAVNLGAANIIDKATTNLRDFLPNRKSSITKEVKPAARALDQLVMQPVRRLLGDKKRLLISPDGALNLVPFDALVDEHNKYLVENYEISYLTSGRDLLRLQNGIKSDNAPLVMADPDFAQGPGPKFGEESFEPLKRLEATADEANLIKLELDKPNVLLQAQATKNALIATNRPTMLHIATHGFFLGSESDNLTEAQRIAVRHKIEEGNSAGISLQNPLLRSGLFFANANAQGEDSTLTALEATGLDLWGTKLVVLSACNTGVGEVKSGDGVYGLRRALVLAGSESQMMSLWPVSDKGTKDLMVAYYEALNHKEGRSAGLRKVRLSFLNKPDRAHPYYWASFIQSGEWANLDGKR